MYVFFYAFVTGSNSEESGEDDLNNRSANLIFHQDYITESLLEDSGMDALIGDQHISKIMPAGLDQSIHLKINN